MLARKRLFITGQPIVAFDTATPVRLTDAGTVHIPIVPRRRVWGGIAFRRSQPAFWLASDQGPANAAARLIIRLLFEHLVDYVEQRFERLPFATD